MNMRVRQSHLNKASRSLLLAIILSLTHPIMAQTTDDYAARWLEQAGPVPAFKPAASVKAWEKQRQEIRQQLWSLLGKLPPRLKSPKEEIVQREDRGDYLLEKFQFDNGAGATVPGYLLLPKNTKEKSPAVLYCHWHGGQYDVGKEELFRTNALPEAGGPALVKRGYVVAAIDAYGFGERNGKGPGGPKETGSAGELTASKFNLWLGRTLWGMMVRDDLMALDYLCARPEVDAARMGVTGISMGATRTWWLMALDDRPKTGVAVACLTRYQDIIQTYALKAHGIYYFVPGLLNHFDTEAVVALAAPRPTLFMTGGEDAGSPVEGIRKIEAAVKPVYQAYKKPEAFQSIIYPGLGHVYTSEMWRNTLDWLDKSLRKEP